MPSREESNRKGTDENGGPLHGGGAEGGTRAKMGKPAGPDGIPAETIRHAATDNAE